MKINYRPFRISDTAEITAMMKALCHEDPGGHIPTDAKVRRTLTEFRRYPDKGTIFLIEADAKIAGYCLVMYYWSNEFGGNVLNIDEFYVKPAWRGRGLGTEFLQYLIANRINDCVAMELETMPDNERARRLYERVGFKLSDRKHYVYEFNPEKE